MPNFKKGELSLKILMYGGSGIISSEITSLAIKKGFDVAIITRGKRKLFINSDATSITADLRNESLSILQKKVSGYYDTVIDFLSYTLDELKKNMELARGHCTQYIFVSSATVYDTKHGRYRESDSIGHSEWQYAVNKATCETYLSANAKNYGFSYTIIRPYITYGRTRIPLQFGPIEYYTVIHRMNYGKCVPVYNEDVKCTLTSSKDFAVATVSLIQNPKAFGEAYHITGKCETTWMDVLKIVSNAFNVKCDIIKIPESILRNVSLSRGLDVAEVLADKGRNMLFDSTKINMLIPDFKGEQMFADEVPEIVNYYKNTPVARRVNYAWDGCIDHMLIHSDLLTKAQKKKLHYYGSENSRIKDKLNYYCNRYQILFVLSHIIKKIKNIKF